MCPSDAHPEVTHMPDERGNLKLMIRYTLLLGVYF
jgi:hypothetical protein